MGQAPSNQSTPKPGTPPTTTPAAKPTETPATTATTTTTTGTTPAPADDAKKSKRKVFVVLGEVKEFDSINQAEKYLNSPDAPKENYTVLQGMRTRKSTKVTLR